RAYRLDLRSTRTYIASGAAALLGFLIFNRTRRLLRTDWRPAFARYAYSGVPLGGLHALYFVGAAASILVGSAGTVLRVLPRGTLAKIALFFTLLGIFAFAFVL